MNKAERNPLAYDRRTPRLAWTIAVRETDLPSTACLVAFALSTYMNTEAQCWPSYTALAKATGLTTRAVGTHVRWLHRHGWLDRVGDRKSTKGGRPVAVWEGRVPAAVAMGRVLRLVDQDVSSAGGGDVP